MNLYFQIVKPVGSNNLVGGNKTAISAAGNAANRKQTGADSASSMGVGNLVAANRKVPGLGKGVPPPVPPNKPAVGPAAKKDPAVGGKRDAKETLGLTLEAGKQSMVTGLQGLKFGISIGGSGGSSGANDGSGKLKASTDGSGQSGGGGPLSTKKFFSNIESKS